MAAFCSAEMHLPLQLRLCLGILDSLAPSSLDCAWSCAGSKWQHCQPTLAARCAVQGPNCLKPASVNPTWLFAESAEQAEQQAEAASDPEKVFREGVGTAQPSVQAKAKRQGATSRPMAPSEMEDMIQPSPTDEGNSAERDIDVQVKLAACSSVPMSSSIGSFCD